MRVGAEIPRGTVPALCGKKAFRGEGLSAEPHSSGPHSSWRFPRNEARVRLPGLSAEAKRRNARSVILETERTEPEGFKAPGKGVRGEE